MIVITSAAYVDAELQSEFGRLPPAFLPVGNRRLFERQAALLARHFPHEAIYLSLPDDFVPPQRDSRRLERLGITVVGVPQSLSLAESVLYVINVAADYTGGVRLLHGDTVFNELPSDWDCVSVAESFDDYAWHIVDTSQPAPVVWSGYFSFRSIGTLARCLVASRGQFDSGVTAYTQSYPLKRVCVQGWLDFGHVNTFFRSRAHVTTQRAFNHLKIQDHRVQKSGHPSKKIEAEARWFHGLPSSLRTYTPQLLHLGADQKGGFSYELEYLCLAPLNELYVHGANPTSFWQRLFLHLRRWFGASSEALALSDAVWIQVRRDTQQLLEDKTRERVALYLEQRGLSGFAPISLNGKPLPCLTDIVDTCIARSQMGTVMPGVLHGDLCFSNVLFDSRADRIKIIDPRGMSYDGSMRHAGDLRYDLAKLTHSVCGYYDFIIADAFDIDTYNGLDFELTLHVDERVEQINQLFRSLPMLGTLAPRDVMPQVVLLFFSMLPLHADSPRRQRALLANGLRLFAEME
jgi:hypothetical protein